MHTLLSFLFGAVVGLALGLTGGGGSILAVPLLVYGLGLPPREAIGLSLLVVGSTALIGAIGRWLRREVDPTAALFFSLPTILATPAGAYIGRHINGQLLLLGYSLLVLVVALRLWMTAHRTYAPSAPSFSDTQPALWRRWIVLIGSGLVTGLLAGLFGVGGGFLIVPALVLAAHLEIHRATATSLVVITLIGVSGTISYYWTGHLPDYRIASFFVLGGWSGMAIGVTFSRHLAGATLQRLFAVILVVVGLSVLVRTLPLSGHQGVTSPLPQVSPPAVFD